MALGGEAPEPPPPCPGFRNAGEGAELSVCPHHAEARGSGGDGVLPGSSYELCLLRQKIDMCSSCPHSGRASRPARRLC